MKMILATAIASLAFIGTAFAETVEGVVQSVDPATRTNALQDGQSFTAPETAAIEDHAVGARIRVTVDDSTGAITSIETAS